MQYIPTNMNTETRKKKYRNKETWEISIQFWISDCVALKGVSWAKKLIFSCWIIRRRRIRKKELNIKITSTPIPYQTLISRRVCISIYFENKNTPAISTRNTIVTNVSWPKFKLYSNLMTIIIDIVIIKPTHY